MPFFFLITIIVMIAATRIVPPIAIGTMIRFSSTLAGLSPGFVTGVDSLISFSDSAPIVGISSSES